MWDSDNADSDHGLFWRADKDCRYFDGVLFLLSNLLRAVFKCIIFVCLFLKETV